MSRRGLSNSQLIGIGALGLVAVFAAFVVIITVRYRDGLQSRLRANLTSGATALRVADTPTSYKSLLDSLAAEGISVDLAGITAPGGTLPTNPGDDLMTVHETIPVNGVQTSATLTASRAGINRQVHSLEVTEAIGGALALILLVALARALVLLDRAALEARSSEAAMRTFLADASHELRTPVAALHATAERLLRDQPARPERDAVEAQLARDSRRLGSLIDDLLNLARLDAREVPRRESVDLAQLAATAVASASAASAASVNLLADRPVPATADPDALIRAIHNLLDNALSVADTVVVEASQTADGPVLTVTDNGPGVPNDQRERIFEPFVRLPGSPGGGTGLGLAIVRRTLAAHGGTVTCAAAPGGGSRFTLRLPGPSRGGSL